MDIDPFLDALKKLGTQERVGFDQSYHKSSRIHWGVSVPHCRTLVRSTAKTLPHDALIPFAKKLWETNIFDPMVCACLILEHPRTLPSLTLWDQIGEFLKQVDGWALEDGMAHAAWKCLLADVNLLDQVEDWTKHSNFWVSRAALVYTLPFAKPGRDPERMLEWASLYASDPEWFIQKAIGWWLRVLGQHNPERVALFLESHWDQLKYVAKKESTRKLSAAWKSRLTRS